MCFYSSRRRHTRCSRDWSSDVCSSDLNRIVTITERAFTTTVNGIEHIESVSLRGVAISRLYFHPNVPIEAAIAQVNAQAQQIVRVLPPGIFPPLIIQSNAPSVPRLLASLSGDHLPEEP